MTSESVRAIAIYLPQFHPITENDEWWGKGFTEWTNVVKARPLFKGHYQPHLPADLGFYDLRVAEVREAQAALAREYGIHGFCYYHYWFNGRRLLNRPLDELLAAGKPDFPFCLCWANENWTRRWDGLDEEILIRQEYSAEDDRNHIRWLAPVFGDQRYIKVQGRPLFLVYRLTRLPNPAATVELWRREYRRLGGGELFIANVESFKTDHGVASQLGLDAAVEFAPDWTDLRGVLGRSSAARFCHNTGIRKSPFMANKVLSYETLVEKMLTKPKVNYARIPCVSPCWDNSPRRKSDALIIHGSSPTIYERWLKTVLGAMRPQIDGNKYVFINAWNEWGEGSHLEPCQRWGRAYLEATRRAMMGTPS